MKTTFPMILFSNYSAFMFEICKPVYKKQITWAQIPRTPRSRRLYWDINTNSDWTTTEHPGNTMWGWHPRGPQLSLVVFNRDDTWRSQWSLLLKQKVFHCIVKLETVTGGHRMAVVLPVLSRQAVYRKKTHNQEGQLKKRVQLKQLRLCLDIMVM